MFELFEITKHHNIAGANTVFALTYLVAGTYLIPQVYRHIIDGRWQDPSRMIVGFFIMCIGVAIRTGFWNPWRAFLAEGDAGLAKIYLSYSWMWTWGGTAFGIVGLYLIVFPAMIRIFGRSAWLIAIAGPAVCYVLGLLFAEYFGVVVEYILS